MADQGKPISCQKVLLSVGQQLLVDISNSPNVESEIDKNTESRLQLASLMLVVLRSLSQPLFETGGLWLGNSMELVAKLKVVL
jgi:hypothetical protein